MILLTLAAGLGSRAQQGEYIPKALINVKAKPLVYWSVDSFHSLRASGIIPIDKMFLVVRKSDLETFEFTKQVTDFISPQIQITELQDLTNGPAESAYLGLSQLIQEKKISPDDPIIINDCDHHFNGNRLLFSAAEIKKSTSNEVFLCTTAKNPMDLSWSFVQEINGEVVGVIEKPESHKDKTINFSEGLIGVYGFSKVRYFMEMFENAKADNGKSEFFISKVIDHGIRTKSVTKIAKTYVDNFTSLGTADLINKAIEDDALGGSFKEAGTLFLDLDGTIFRHDNGGGLGAFEYADQPELVELGIPEWIQSTKAAGYSIVITSARNESARNKIVDQLTAFRIPFDHLILGLSGGPRFLFNDLKDSLSCLPTAYAINYPRNDFPFISANKVLTSASKTSIRNEFIGESGERTFLIQEDEKFLIRKQSQANENSRDIIRYQVKWFDVVREFAPENIPTIISTNIHGSDETLYFDTEFIPDLLPFGKYLSQLPEDKKNLKIKELSVILSNIYNIFEVKTNGNMDYFESIISKKALTGVQKGFESLHIRLGMPIQNYVNNQPLKASWQSISKVLNIENKFIQQLLRESRDIRTLIHGDPTLSNIVSTDNGNIYLLDPIGSRVMPDYTATNGLGRANPIFDHSRIRLSLENEYERWPDEIVVEEHGTEMNFFLPNMRKNDDFSQYMSFHLSDGKDTSKALNDLVHITTLARIFPYKAKSKKKEAFYILGVLEGMCSRFSEEFL
jgi:dTDP-glucose pyrophosphorylase